MNLNPSRDREGAGNPEPKQTAERPIPLAYLITFTCYGTRLHGSESGSVDRHQNLAGSDFIPPSPAWLSFEQREMDKSLYELDDRRRALILKSIRNVCVHRYWLLLAVHVRSQHVHVVVAAKESPERVMNTMKAYASRALNQTGSDETGRWRWTRHGSTRYLWKPVQVNAAIEYVVRGQGKPMAVWESVERPW